MAISMRIAQRIASVSVPHVSGSSDDLSTLVLGDAATDGTLTYYHQDHLGGTQVTTDQYGVVTQVYDYYPYGSELLDENLGAPEVPYSFTGKELNEDTGLYYFEARWYDPTIGRFMSGDPYSREFELPQQNFEQFTANKRGKSLTSSNNENYSNLISYPHGKDFEKEMSSQNEKSDYNSEATEKGIPYLENPQNLNQYSYSLNNPLTFTDPTGELTDETLETVFEDAAAIVAGGLTVLGAAALKSPQGVATGMSMIFWSGADAVAEIWNDPDMADVKEGTEEFLGDVVDAAQDYASDFWDSTKELLSGDDN